MLTHKDNIVQEQAATLRELQENYEQLEEQHEASRTDRSLENARVLGIALAKAQNQAELFRHRAHELTEAMGETPNEITNIRGVFETKDHEFSRLEEKAGRFYTQLIQLERGIEQDRDIVPKK